jgi:hypothetical protein
MCNKVDLSLKAMVLKAVPRIYLAAIADATYKFANVSTAQMLQHLVTTYGTINEDDLATNLENCKTAWDPNTPIESVVANTNYCAQFAAAGNDAISDASQQSPSHSQSSREIRSPQRCHHRLVQETSS